MEPYLLRINQLQSVRKALGSGKLKTTQKRSETTRKKISRIGISTARKERKARGSREVFPTRNRIRMT